MTCKDCLYYEHCHSEIAYGIGTDDITGEYLTDIEKRCKSFDNKSDYVKVKHGAWLPNEISFSEDSHTYGAKHVTVCRSTPLSYRCSLCGKVENLLYPYCTCGAKMDLMEYIES